MTLTVRCTWCASSWTGSSAYSAFSYLYCSHFCAPSDASASWMAWQLGWGATTRIYRLFVRSECNLNLFHSWLVCSPSGCWFGLFSATALWSSRQSHCPEPHGHPASSFFHSSLSTFCETIRSEQHHGTKSNFDWLWSRESRRSSCSTRSGAFSESRKSFSNPSLELFGWALV